MNYGRNELKANEIEFVNFFEKIEMQFKHYKKNKEESASGFNFDERYYLNIQQSPYLNWNMLEIKSKLEIKQAICSGVANMQIKNKKDLISSAEHIVLFFKEYLEKKSANHETDYYRFMDIIDDFEPIFKALHLLPDDFDIEAVNKLNLVEKYSIPDNVVLDNKYINEDPENY